MIQYDVPDYFDDYVLQRNDGTLAVVLILSEMKGYEFAYFTFGDCEYVYTISLDKDNPLENEKNIPKEHWDIINRYIDNYGGYDGMLNELQKVYNNYIFGDWGNEYTPDYKSLGKDNVKANLGKFD